MTKNKNISTIFAVISINIAKLSEEIKWEPQVNEIETAMRIYYMQ